MNKVELKQEFVRLYNKYGVDSIDIESLSEEQIAKGAKGHLAFLTNEKKSDFDKDDSKTVKDIFYYFG